MNVKVTLYHKESSHLIWGRGVGKKEGMTWETGMQVEQDST